MAVALTIAGSDSGGGAGIQADLKTFFALGVHGTSAITCVTAQNPKQVCAIQSCNPRIVRAQIEAVFAEFAPRAVKIGMLYSRQIIGEVARGLRSKIDVRIVVDPVMVSTSGRALLQRSAIESLSEELFPLATLVTPNLQEAEILLGRRLGLPEDLKQAAAELSHRFQCAFLVKGGHLRGFPEAVDFLCDGKAELSVSAPFVRGLKTHGTGCTYGAAITAYLALGYPLVKAVSCGKQFISSALRKSRKAGAHTILTLDFS
jgi:hydroxymethylpyrimidine/phosphomethylpyrimidine kinase